MVLKNPRSTSSSPVLFDMSSASSKMEFEKLRKSFPQRLDIVDTYPESLEELFFIRHPWLDKKSSEGQATKEEYIQNFFPRENHKEQGSWVYYPYTHQLVHVLEEKKFFELRTARNRHLITAEEQE